LAINAINFTVTQICISTYGKYSTVMSKHYSLAAACICQCRDDG